MGLESATYVSDLVATNPVVGDNVAEGDDHLRLIKAVLQATFPVASGAIYPWQVSAVSADQTPSTGQNGMVYSVNCTAANRSVTLPSSPAAGYRLGVIKSDSSANTISVLCSGADTINGATSRTISYQYQAELYIYIGSNIWLLISISHPRFMIGPSSGTDERVLRYDGTGFVLQSSPVGISDTGAITGTAAITPASNDGGALGSATLSYSDLFLASGAVVNWNNGDVTLTHSANTLAFAGASNGYNFDSTVSVGDGNNYFRLSGTSPGWVVDNTDEWVYDRTGNIWKPTIGSAIVMQLAAASLSPGVSDAQALGTTSLMWADLFLAAGAVINWNNGNVTLTHAAGTLTLAGATSWSMGTSLALTVGTIELGAAADTTISRASAGVAAVEGETIHTNSISRTLTAAGIELGHASDTTITRSAAGEVAIEGTLVKKVGTETIWIPALAMTPRTTNGAASGTVESSSNKIMQMSLDFDQSTAEYAQFAVRMPKSWNVGTVTAVFVWTANSTSTNSVVWGIQGAAIGNDETIDTASQFGTAQTVTDANTATAYQAHHSAATGAMTIGSSAAAQDWVVFQVYRDASNGSDTLAVDAMLLGVTLNFTSNASTDA